MFRFLAYSFERIRPRCENRGRFFVGEWNRSDADAEAVAVTLVDQGVSLGGVRGSHGGRVPLNPLLEP